MTEIAPSGQTAMQAPQPVQLSIASAGAGGVPRRGRNISAPASQISRQHSQWTPFSARQAASSTTAFRGQAGSRDRSKTPSPQLDAQSPQKVQTPDPREKSTPGNPPSTVTSICSGQAAMHFPHRVQLSTTANSSVQGGRREALRTADLPRRKLRRDRSTRCVLMPASRIAVILNPAVPAGRRPSGRPKWQIRTRRRKRRLRRESVKMSLQERPAIPVFQVAEHSGRPPERPVAYRSVSTSFPPQ